MAQAARAGSIVPFVTLPSEPTIFLRDAWESRVYWVGGFTADTQSLWATVLLVVAIILVPVLALSVIVAAGAVRGIFRFSLKLGSALQSNSYVEGLCRDFTKRVLDNVGFACPSRNDPAMEGISVDTQSAQLAGLVGCSVSGRTTLTDLLLGMLRSEPRPSRPADRSLAEIGATWKQRLGCNPLPIILLDETVDTNVSLGISDYVNLAKHEKSTKRARRDRVAASLAHGVACRFWELGFMLALGQRQRVGIARPVYRDPKLRILDKATSALNGTRGSEVLVSLCSVELRNRS
jgi:ABC-type transport system involved in cytochrome bd biosynthesis fused ATPase/permease subunit